MKALVTGGAGFVGSHVVRQLLDQGRDVRVLVLPGEDESNLEGLNVERLEGDVRDAARMREAVRDCDVVFHLAAVYALWLPRPELMREVNVEGTRNLLEAARAEEVDRFVHCSSIAVFGGQGPGRDATETSGFGLGPTHDIYSRSKYDGHRVAEGFASELDVVIVAPCGPVGPGDVGPTPTGKLLLAAMKLPAIVAIDTDTNFIHVRDVAAGHLLAAERGKTGESYLLGNENLSFRELAVLIMEVTGNRKPIATVPRRVARLGGRVGVRWARHISGRAPYFTPAAIDIARLGLRADCSRAVTELGLPQTPIREALHDALKWFEIRGRV